MRVNEESTYDFRKEKRTIVSSRKTRYSDFPKIRKLIQSNSLDLFGSINLDQVHEKACLSLVQLNEREEIMSYVGLCTYPNIPSVLPSDWISWMLRHYGLKNVSTGNVMFIHFLVWDIGYTGEFFDKLLNAIFSMATFCCYVILIHPPSIIPVTMIEEHMTRVAPIGERDSYKVQTLYIRYLEFIAINIIRIIDSVPLKNENSEEDNDAIVQLIDSNCTKFKDQYEEYSISQMIRYPDSQSKIIVGEIAGVVKGVMIVTRAIDIELINEIFELDLYNGLSKHQDQNELENLNFLQGTEGHKSLRRSQVTRGEKIKDEIFVCRCSQEELLGEGEVCEVCFPEFEMENVESLGKEDQKVNGKIVKRMIFKDNEPKIESDGKQYKVDENSSEKEANYEKEASDGEVANDKEEIYNRSGTKDQEIANNKTENKKREEINNEEKTNVEEKINEADEKTRLIEEEIKEFKVEEKEENRLEEMEYPEEVLIENINMRNFSGDIEETNLPFANIRPTNLSEDNFEYLMGTDDEEKNCSLSQIHPAQSNRRISTTSGTDILGKREVLPMRAELSGLAFQEIFSGYSTANTIGKPNAFVLKLFSAHDDLDKLRGQDFLESAFDCFSDLDCCVLLLPSTHRFFPFLEYFTRVPLRYDKDFSSALYITHRAIFSGSIKSREAEPHDLEKLAELLFNIPTKNSVLKDVEEAIFQRDREKGCYVFFCDDTMIGVAVVRFYATGVVSSFLISEIFHLHQMTALMVQRFEILLSIEKHIHFLKSHYHIEDHVLIENVPFDAHGQLLQFVIMPIFATCHQFFCQEILRLSQMTILYYRFYESDANALTRTRPIINCLDVMIPIEPKVSRVIFSFQQYFEPKFEPPMTCRQEEKFSLFLLTPQCSINSKSDINIKFVVVGASDCGMAFIEYLALRSKSKLGKFTNLTLISSNGLPYEKKRPCLEKNLIPFKGLYCYDYTHMKGDRAWLNVVSGTVIDINRKEKRIFIKSVGYLSYDYLILTCGVQFQKPKFSKETPGDEKSNPINCLTINDDTEAADCIQKLKNWTDFFKTQKSIIFYGNCIECYCAINAFLDIGVKGSWITLIEPLTGYDNHEKIFFNDFEVDATIIKEIAKNGVKILSKWKLFEWELKNDFGGHWVIESLQIESNSEFKEISCDILMDFSKKRVQLTNFKTFLRAGLVFDGLLVIDAENRTNDPFIFAGGTVTKYSRKYMADDVKIKYFNSVEIGEKLAQNLMKKIETHLEGKEESIKHESDKIKLLPSFQNPRSISCILPGGFYYLHVHKPGKEIERTIEISQNTCGTTVFKTGSCGSEIGYFRIHINTFGFVESVTCCSKKSFEIHNLMLLYGKHETLLNKLKIRFENSSIVDFYSYFREPWATALFSDNFQSFQVENRAILLSKFSGSEDLTDEILKLLIKANWHKLSDEEQEEIELKFIGSAYHENIEKNLINFLEYYANELPMYCTPQRASEILKDFENSPLFTPQ